MRPQADGDAEQAAADYAAAAEEWQELGYVFNHALSLLGARRCLLALDRRAPALEALRDARAIFEGLEVTHLIADVDVLLVAPVA